MGKVRGIHITLLITTGILLGALPVGPALAADAGGFGTVDVERAFNDYEKKQQLDKDLVAFVEQLRQKFDLRQTHKLLDKEEFDQLAELKQNATPTDADTEKIRELEELSTQREKELQALQQKTGPTDEEKARLIALQDQAKKSEAELTETQKQFEKDVTKRRFDFSKEVMGEVETAVAAVAKEKELAIVFNKSFGELGFIIYSSVDITDDVLKKLNKK